MAVWINPPDTYEYWTWVNDSGHGPETEWDNREEALLDLREAEIDLPGVDRWLQHIKCEFDHFVILDEEYIPQEEEQD